MVHQVGNGTGRRGLRQRAFAFAYRTAMSDDLMGEVADYKQKLLAPLRGTVVELGPGTGANFTWLTPGGIHWIGRGLPGACADAVISTHVLCSVTDVGAAYREALRLLRPGGVFAFVEHVGAPQGTGLRRLQRFIRPAWGWVADGCHPDRDLEAAIRAAGFASVEITRFRIAAPVVSPHIAGQAWKSV